MAVLHPVFRSLIKPILLIIGHFLTDKPSYIENVFEFKITILLHVVYVTSTSDIIHWESPLFGLPIAQIIVYSRRYRQICCEGETMVSVMYVMEATFAALTVPLQWVRYSICTIRKAHYERCDDLKSTLSLL